MTIDLQTDCGALGNGASADDAFLLAFEKVKQGISNVINVDGSHSLTRPLGTVNFLNKSSGLILQGHGSRSQILPQMPASGIAFVFGNLEFFECRDLFLATADQAKQQDCGAVFQIGHCPQARFLNTHFYGLSARGSQVGLLWLYNSGSTLDHCTFRGSGVGASAMVTVQNWMGFHAHHCNFIDFGTLNEKTQFGAPDKNGEVTKTNIAGSSAWMAFVGTALGVLDPAIQQGFYNGAIPLIDFCNFDEGAAWAIEFKPDVAGPRPRGLSVKHCGFNVGVGGGIYAQHAETLLAEDSFFTYNTNKTVVKTMGVDHVILRRCRNINGRGIVETDGWLTAEDCKGFEFNAPTDKLTIIEHGRVVSGPNPPSPSPLPVVSAETELEFLLELDLTVRKRIILLEAQ